jgi:hypothetical protein
MLAGDILCARRRSCALEAAVGPSVGQRACRALAFTFHLRARQLKRGLGVRQYHGGGGPQATGHRSLDRLSKPSRTALNPFKIRRVQFWNRPSYGCPRTY